MKKYIAFYLIAIFMITNDALFTWIGGLTGIVFWRQLLWLVGMILLAKVLRNRKYDIPFVRRVCNNYKVLFLFVFLFSIITILINGFSPIRVLYTLIEYAFGLPFIIFPFLCEKCGWSRKGIDLLFIFLGVFLATGLIIDYLSGGVITTFFTYANMQEFADFKAGRHHFLSTTDSIFTLYFSLCLMCCFHYYHITSNVITKYLLLALSLYFVFGGIFCGARQTLAGMLIVEAFGVYSIVRKNKSSLILVGLACVFLLLMLPYAGQMLSDNSGFQERYTQDAIKEDERSGTWAEGFSHIFINTTIRRLTIGDGVAITNENFAGNNESKSRHYENSFFARMIDIGVVAGMYMILIPVYYIMKYKRKNVIFPLYLGVVSCYLFIGMVSPNAIINQSQMSIFILLGLFFIDNQQGYDAKKQIGVA